MCVCVCVCVCVCMCVYVYESMFRTWLNVGLYALGSGHSLSTHELFVLTCAWYA
jgi:hypothetical protein